VLDDVELDEPTQRGQIIEMMEEQPLELQTAPPSFYQGIGEAHVDLGDDAL
jgi:hypothetical protein